ncbi:Cullin-domain-containing protein [Trametes meyenii]|nr:Cullin-domain-containing protein [Trametes meyenii]
MTDVFTLLTLPRTSEAFSALPAQAVAVAPPSSKDTTRSASPPRKIARLDAASDAASAPSSRLGGAADAAADRRGPIVLKVVGHPIAPVAASANEADYALVRRTIRALLDPKEQGALPATYDRVSRACRAAVSEAGRGEGLYDAVKMDLERCVGNIERALVNEERRGVEWLVPFTEACAWFERQVGLLESLLAYLDTLYVAERPLLLSLRQLAYSMFRNSVIMSAQVTQAIIVGITHWLEWERTNGAQHPLRGSLPVLVRHLRAHGLYTDTLESTYLTCTHTFYTNESNTLAASGKLSARDFLRRVHERSVEEAERARAVMPAGSVAGVQDTAESALLTGRLQWLATDALEVLMGERKVEPLQRMYGLFKKVGGLKVLSAAFKLYVQKTVKGIVTDKEHDDEMVTKLLEFKAFADKVVAQCFVDETPSPVPSQPVASSSKAPATAAPAPTPNRDFQYDLQDAFRAGFKARRNTPAEMLAKHMDRALRRGQKGRGDAAFAAELDAVLALYRFTDDMDVFRAFYQRALAKRLLLGRSASDDFERAVLKKLKEQYDPEFGTSDNMFTDLALSRDLMQEFLEHRRRRGTDDSTVQKLTVMVLQRSNWPFSARKTDVDLPRWMQDDLGSYTEYYKKKHQGRKLDWDHALGTATLKTRFKGGEKELSVSLYQAVVLLLFNTDETLSYADIKAQTRLEDGELGRTLQSLACGKKRVLKKEPAGKEVNATDVFRFNADFTDARFQVHINSIQAKETAEETRRTQSSIEADRKHALDAAIVRVMKGKKELHYEQLKTATIEAVRKHFVPEVGMIKQRIQGLVEQEYLRRDEEDMNRYIYVA